MTKKEKHQEINREFFKLYENDFTISDDGDGGRVILEVIDQNKIEGGFPSDNYITYHLSRHSVDSLNWSSDYIKMKEQEMGKAVYQLIKKYKL